MSKKNDRQPKQDLAQFRKHCLETILEPRVFVMDAQIKKRYAEVRNKTRKHYDMWAEILGRCECAVGSNKLKIWATVWTETHPNMKTSSGSIYRVRKQVADFGLISLLNDGKVPQSTVTDKYFELFRKTYFPSVQAAYDRVLEMALNDGAVTDVKDFPSVSAFERKLRSIYTPEKLKALRYKIRKKDVV